MKYQVFQIQGLVNGEFKKGETPTITIKGKDFQITLNDCTDSNPKTNFRGTIQGYKVHGDFYPKTNRGQISLPDSLVTKAKLG